MMNRLPLPPPLPALPALPPHDAPLKLNIRRTPRMVDEIIRRTPRMVDEIFLH